MNVGDIVLANDSGSISGFNSLFVRLNAIRQNHLNKDGQSSNANSVLSTSFNQNVAVQNSLVQPNVVTVLKNNLTTLANSAWLNDTFASKITIPATGDLLEAKDFNSFSTVISEVESICPNYSKYSEYGKYGEYGEYGKYGKYSNYSNYANYSQEYGNYGASYNKYSNAIYG